MSGWLAFWSRPHRVYVDDRHRRVHYARVADDLLALLPGPGAKVLDFGCGEALEADRVARACGHLYLLEAAEPVRGALEARFAGHRNVTVLGPSGLSSLPAGSLDLVVVNSVLQYLSVEEFERWLSVWREKLATRGLLVLGDVLPPGSSALAERGDYRRLRRDLGLTCWEPGELTRRLEAADFTVERRARNLGFNPRRMTFLARPRPKG